MSRPHAVKLRGVLEGTSVPTGELGLPSAEITLGQQLRQIRNAARLLGPDWALSLGARLHAATHGPVGIAAVSAPSMRQSLGVMTRFSQIRSPHFCLRVHVQEKKIRVVPEDRVALREDERIAARHRHAQHPGLGRVDHRAPDGGGAIRAAVPGAGVCAALQRLLPRARALRLP